MTDDDVRATHCRRRHGAAAVVPGTGARGGAPHRDRRAGQGGGDAGLAGPRIACGPRGALAHPTPALRWVHTMPAGGGAHVKEAGLTAAELERVVFTTSAGVSAPPLSEFAVFGVLAGSKRLPGTRGGQARATLGERPGAQDARRAHRARRRGRGNRSRDGEEVAGPRVPRGRGVRAWTWTDWRPCTSIGSRMPRRRPMRSSSPFPEPT